MEGAAAGELPRRAKGGERNVGGMAEVDAALDQSGVELLRAVVVEFDLELGGLGGKVASAMDPHAGREQAGFEAGKQAGQGRGCGGLEKQSCVGAHCGSVSFSNRC